MLSEEIRSILSNDLSKLQVSSTSANALAHICSLDSSCQQLWMAATVFAELNHRGLMEARGTRHKTQVGFMPSYQRLKKCYNYSSMHFNDTEFVQHP